MKNRSLFVVLKVHFVAFGILLSLLSGCGSGATSEAPKRTIVEIDVAPTTAVIQVGATLQLQAEAKFSDGTTGDVSSSVSWKSSDTSLATVNSSGLVAAVALGRPAVTATSGTASATANLAVILAPTATVPRFAFVPNMADGTLSNFTVDLGSGLLRHNGYQLVGHIPSSVVVEPRGKFVYVANSDSNNISAFAIGSDGQLSTVPGQPFDDETSPLSLVVDPTGSFLYSANSATANVQGYSIEPTTGVLTALTTSPFAAAGSPSALVIDPLGKFLYAADGSSNNLSTYSIDIKSGILTPLQGSPFSAGSSPSAIAVDPAGAFLYVANSVSSDVSVFSRDLATGTLTQVQGSPFPTGSGQEISGMAISPDGKTIYVSNFGSSNVSALSVGATGKLTAVAGSPFAVDADPRQLQLDPGGKFAYVPILSACEVEIFSIEANGALSSPKRIRTRQQAAAIAFSVGTTAVKYSPKFFYATNLTSNNLSAFSVDATSGVLTPIFGAPFATGANPFGVAADPWAKFVYASNGFNSVTNKAEKSISGFIVASNGH